MSRTNLEYLFQVTSPAADRSVGTNSRSGDNARFGDHLSRVASPSEGRPNGSASSSRSASKDQHVDRALSTKSADSNGRDSGRTRAARGSRNDDEVRAPSAAKKDRTTTSDGLNKADAATDDDESRNDQAGAAAVADAEAARQNAAAAADVATASEAEFNAALAADASDSNTDDSGNGASPKNQLAAAGAEGPVEPIVETSHAGTGDGVNATIAGSAGDPSNKDSRDAPGTSDPAIAGEDIAALSTTGQSTAAGDSTLTAELTGTTAGPSNADLAPLETAGTDDATGPGDSANDANRSANPSLAAKSVVAAAVTGAAESASKSTSDGNQPASKTGTSRLDGVADATSRFTATAGTRRGSHTNSMDDTPRIDPARFVSRVAKAFHTAQERGGTLQLRLSPPELGALRLELTVKDGAMSASLETENATAKRVLLEHLPALRDRLAEQNIRIERFDVDVRREGAGGQADPRAAQDQQQPQQGQSERRQPAQPQREVVAPLMNQAVAQPLGTSTGINLVA